MECPTPKKRKQGATRSPTTSTARRAPTAAGCRRARVVFAWGSARRLPGDLPSRYYVVSRETLFQSPVALTPYQSETRIDDAALKAIIADAYVKGGILPA